jgi:hypothetical protein
MATVKGHKDLAAERTAGRKRRLEEHQVDVVAHEAAIGTLKDTHVKREIQIEAAERIEDLKIYESSRREAYAEVRPLSDAFITEPGAATASALLEAALRWDAELQRRTGIGVGFMLAHAIADHCIAANPEAIAAATHPDRFNYGPANRIGAVHAEVDRLIRQRNGAVTAWWQRLFDLVSAVEADMQSGTRGDPATAQLRWDVIRFQSPGALEALTIAIREAKKAREPAPTPSPHSAPAPKDLVFRGFEAAE